VAARGLTSNKERKKEEQEAEAEEVEEAPIAHHRRNER